MNSRDFMLVFIPKSCKQVFEESDYVIGPANERIERIWEKGPDEVE